VREAEVVFTNCNNESPAAETAWYLKGNRALSFPLVGNPSERFWTSQNDRNKGAPQQGLWGIENLTNE